MGKPFYLTCNGSEIWTRAGPAIHSFNRFVFAIDHQIACEVGDAPALVVTEQSVTLSEILRIQPCAVCSFLAAQVAATRDP
jgi:hypothetical protein